MLSIACIPLLSHCAPETTTCLAFKYCPETILFESIFPEEVILLFTCKGPFKK